MLVHFLTARTFKAHCLTFPLRVFSEQLAAAGITVSYYSKYIPQLEECDVLCICQEVFFPSQLNRTPPNRNALLEKVRRNVGTIVWFDTSDGTGKTSFSVLPYVDLYAKSQLLKDRTHYMGELYRNDYYADYYHKRGIADDQPPGNPAALLPPEYLSKLSLSWNLGLGDWLGFRNASTLERVWKIFYPWPHYWVSPVGPDSTPRSIDVSFRGKVNYTRAATTYHRQQAVRQLKEFAGRSNYKVIYEGRLPYREYRQEMRSSKVVCSPFGLGEINGGRDFECLMDGALLVKPDMSHLETWPNYFEPGVTYMPFAWDYSD